MTERAWYLGCTREDVGPAAVLVGDRARAHLAAELLDDATFDGDAMRRIVVPLLGDAPRLARMAAAAEQAGTRNGTDNVIALVDRALRTAGR